MAIGANSADVVHMILGEAGLLSGIGLVLCSTALSRVAVNNLV